MLPLIGHKALRARLSAAVARNALPASLLLHGAALTGKERLALWLGALLLCEAPTAGGEPCETCQQCRYVAAGAHPDLHWYFPRPKLKDADPDVDDVVADLAEAVSERVEAKGAWAQAAPTDSIYVATVRALLRRAVLTPALATRKVIVVADAERMVSQEGSDQAANAFLKLLEEPAANTTIVLTSSAPTALLPTIRSRVVAVRVAPLEPAALRELAALGVTREGDGRVARSAAAALLDAAGGTAAARYKQAFAYGASGARGAFTETLDALTQLLHERARHAAERGHDDAARGAARGVEYVEEAKRLARQNVNPQLISVQLLADLARLVA